MLGLITIKDLFIVGSILSLLLIGVGITLRSGLVAAGRERCSRIFGNLSRMVVALASWAAFLSMIQQLVGLRVSFLP